MRTYQLKAVAVSVAVATLVVPGHAYAAASSGQQALPAAATSYAGRWLVTSSDDPERSTTGVIADVELYLEGQELKAKMLAVKKDDKPVSYTCDQCTGSRNRMQIVGSIFVWGLRWNGEKWVDGEVLDVRPVATQGTIANCEIEMLNVNRVRIYGYLFTHWLGKGSEWTRLRR